MTQEKGDILYGVEAMGYYLGGIRPRQVRNLIDKHRLPVFKMGRRVCARVSVLREWVREREVAAEVARAAGE